MTALLESLGITSRAEAEDIIESLIGALDEMEPDPDLEPSLGAPERHPGQGWGEEPPKARRAHSQEAWATGDLKGDDREDDDSDDEHSLGWGVGNQTVLHATDERENVSEDEGAQDDREPELGWTEEIDQERRLDTAAGYGFDGDEPDLGWAESHGRGIIGDQNCLDDREDDDEREKNGDEADYDGGEVDAPIFTPGGGSVSQYEDGWRPAPGSGVAPAMEALRLRNGDVARKFAASRPPDAIPELKASDFKKLPWG